MSLNTDPEIRNKLARNYQEELNMHKAKAEYEKEMRIKEEQNELMRVQQRLEKELQNEQARKHQIQAWQYADYVKSAENKRIKDWQNYEEKLKEENVSLQMNSEERLKKYHQYITKLSDKVDTYAQNYNKFNDSYSQVKQYNPLTSRYSPVKQSNKTIDNYSMNYPLNKPSDKGDIIYNSGTPSRNPYDNYSVNPYDSRLNSGRNNNQLGGIQREATTITNTGIYDKRGNSAYEEYKDINKEYDNYNRIQVEENKKFKEELFYQRKLQEEARHKEMENWMYMQKEEKYFDNEKKKKYRQQWDDQLKVQIPTKLKNESYTQNAVISTPQFQKENLYQYAPDYSFINKNKFVEVNPYCAKRYDWGDSNLQMNPIINPMFNYKYNKYLFKENKGSMPMNPRSSSQVFRSAGLDITN